MAQPPASRMDMGHTALENPLHHQPDSESTHKTLQAGAGSQLPQHSTGTNKSLRRFFQSVVEMAFVPDLDMLESRSLNEETFYDPDCLCPQKKPRLDTEVMPPRVGIRVTVTKGHPARSFRRAAVLVVAMTKLLKQPTYKDFADSDLGGFLDDIFEPVSFQWIEGSYARAPIFRYTRSQSFDILDIDHKCFVLESPTQLVALHLQGPATGRKVKLNIALYRPKSSQGGPGTGRVPVALGIKGFQLYMSCVMSGTEPVLQLEEADIRRDIESVELTRFIFYRLDSPAEGTTRFESAAFPGWFICTSLQPRQPVGITNQPDQVNIATYELSGR